jgi:hypothetical protein
MKKPELTLISNDNEMSTDEMENKISDILNKNTNVIGKVLLALGSDTLSAEDKETILLWLVGTSKGVRGEFVGDDFALFTLARAWQHAASKVAN